MRKSAEYFHVKMILEDKEALEKSGPAVFALEPHDILPLSIFAFNDSLNGFSGHKCLGCLTSACFQVPLMKHIYTWVNAHSVAKKAVMKLLESGVSPVICPGGMQEVTHMKTEKECVLYLKSRLGFIKLAILYGRPIVPCFSFGLRNTFAFWQPNSKLLLAIAKRLGFLPMMFFGLWNCPLGPGKPCDYVNVVGKPIAVERNENPSEEELRRVQAVYIAETVRIFETYKAEFGMGDVSVRVI